MSQYNGVEKVEWTAVAQQLGTGRTSAQVAQRWCRVLNPEIQKKAWRIEEDGDLLDLHYVHQTKWSVIASLMRGRSDTQCRNRYVKLNVSMKKPWTTGEDGTLFTCREKNMSWEQISDLLGFSSKKTHIRYPIVCKMRYTALTGIDNDYEEIGIGALQAVRKGEEMSPSEVSLNRCG